MEEEACVALSSLVAVGVHGLGAEGSWCRLVQEDVDDAVAAGCCGASAAAGFA